VSILGIPDRNPSISFLSMKFRVPLSSSQALPERRIYSLERPSVLFSTDIPLPLPSFFPQPRLQGPFFALEESRTCLFFYCILLSLTRTRVSFFPKDMPFFMSGIFFPPFSLMATSDRPWSISVVALHPSFARHRSLPTSGETSLF